MTMFVLKKNNIHILYNTRVFHHNSKITLARHSAKLNKVLASFCIRKEKKLTALFLQLHSHLCEAKAFRTQPGCKALHCHLCTKACSHYYLAQVLAIPLAHCQITA